MAIHEATTHPFPAQGRTHLTITSEDISRYAEVVALVSQLESQQRILRSELLALRAAGAEQETDSPYLLAFIDQERRTVEWKTYALELAAKVYGIEEAAVWKLEVEASAAVQPVTQIRVKPNPAFAAGLTKPVMSIRFPITPQLS